MGRLFKTYLSGSTIYCCSTCKCHLAVHEDIMSKQFQGRHGRAYLFNNVVNISLGPKEERVLITGLHTVADIYCNVCHTVIGWKYLEAYEESQRYKENKYIVERKKMVKESEIL
ncbi:Protein yippee-like 3 [Galdieria sulphuraria]|uniref:Protein yippee-like n=3 Tax=Galdieria TaxID=83373 RepID=M2WVM1_GALSU|nr:uncharacterized protein Gasu_45230 [Galdieria sulphuraria]EME28025.1 hypothetical protein Gasu_45230 [Galdieria sulphuraria]KAK4528418.1 hypothetical protein GAYE_SCF56G6360 [Galdieria yellowstonensis]GJD11746.1 Protein yippee-like 3 [Galdieria sulphuraria]GJQ13889.1 hypothetical protein GpartN1_g5680.t1 [Galdieria partita]|eukprot:XP_005704545.1 hypothetical protein Gasu_45230 [Galdieria sulphuraria]